MTLLLDAGAFIAFERDDRTLHAYLDIVDRDREVVRTTTAVVAQVWRDGRRQARLARLLSAVEEVALSPARARSLGELLRRSATADIADASLVEIARDGDEILTSDVDDIRRLADAAGKKLFVTPIARGG